MSHRFVLWLCLAAVPGCFDAIIDTPGATDGGASTTTTTTGESASSTTVGVSVTAASSTTIPDDVDSTGTAGETTTTGTTGTTGDDGLVCGHVAPICGDEPWALTTCEDPCPPASPAGVCVLEALRDRGCGAFVLERCAPECQRVHYAFRCGTDDVIVQTTLLDGEGEPKEILPPELCTLVDAPFFAGCLESFTAPCSDPALWVSRCGPYASESCPI